MSYTNGIFIVTTTGSIGGGGGSGGAIVGPVIGVLLAVVVTVIIVIVIVIFLRWASGCNYSKLSNCIIYVIIY